MWIFYGIAQWRERVPLQPATDTVTRHTIVGPIYLQAEYHSYVCLSLFSLLKRAIERIELHELLLHEICGTETTSTLQLLLRLYILVSVMLPFT